MRLQVAYGRDGLELELPDSRVEVIEPLDLPGLDDEQRSLRNALLVPIDSAPLRELVANSGEVAIVFPDVTRPMPSSRVLPVLLEHLEEIGVRDDRIVLLSGTGTHRANTTAELAAMVGQEVFRRFEIVNHDCRDHEALTQIGTLPDGVPVLLNSRYVAASTRILTGFIEPHFFAGFSGGPKGACPGLAGLETILECHNIDRIGSPLAVYGVLDGNPVHEMVQAVSRMLPPTFWLDVTINKSRQITGVFAGGLPTSHRRGCEFVRKTAMRQVTRRFDIVITTNSGYPLDQNLYQTVKGMAAAARILHPGGSMVIASECSDGLPNGGHYAQMLEASSDPDDALNHLAPAGATIPDQWEVQVQALIQRQSTCYLYSEGLTPVQIRSALLEPIESVDQTVAELVRANPSAEIAVLPQGPQTIPYVVD
jgi:nickel-dependent lactate racemase